MRLLALSVIPALLASASPVAEPSDAAANQPAKVRYLSECKDKPYTRYENVKFYGRDVDVTLTCWTEGGDVMGDKHWYKTTDNCFVSQSGLWKTPDRDALGKCAAAASDDVQETSLVRRWLTPGKIGEDTAACYTCPSNEPNTSSCPVTKTYEFDQTVISQCVSEQEKVYPNGSFAFQYWMLTTDWCYVWANNFYEPPYDQYRYPRCSNWKGY